MKSTAERFRGIRRKGIQKSGALDLYHRILTISWPGFFLIYAIFFIAFNLVFAGLYCLDETGVANTHGNFIENFYFSIETFATIGYGYFVPTSYYAHTLVIIQSMAGMLFTALLTGLAFSKFSKPTARIHFSKKVLITDYDGKRMLMFRLANLRANQIAEASVRVVALKFEKTKEGVSMRRQFDVSLLRSQSSFFVLSWTVMHEINKQSPFYGLTIEDIKAENIEMSVSVIGHDSTLSQNVHAGCFYGHDDIEFDRQFADLMTMKNGRVTTIDYSKLDQLV